VASPQLVAAVGVVPYAHRAPEHLSGASHYFTVVEYGHSGHEFRRRCKRLILLGAGGWARTRTRDGYVVKHSHDNEVGRRKHLGGRSNVLLAATADAMARRAAPSGRRINNAPRARWTTSLLLSVSLHNLPTPTRILPDRDPS